MHLLYLLLAFAALVATDPPEPRPWEVTAMVNIRAPDWFHFQYVNLGTATLCALQSTDKGAGMQFADWRNPPSAASAWFNLEATLRAQWIKIRWVSWGWFAVPTRPEAQDFAGLGWKQALDELAPVSPWTFGRFEHCDRSILTQCTTQTYKPDPRLGGDGRTFRSTGGVHQHALNKQAGIVLFQPNIPPQAAAKRFWGRDPGVNDLPKFTMASDFLWYDWYRTENKLHRYHKIVRYCGVQHVSDLNTHSLIARYLLERDVHDLQPWPAEKSTFDTTTPQGRALLGTVVGRKCAAFLLQHKSILGIKHITKIRVFRSARTPQGKFYPEMLFWVEDVPAQDVKPDPPPGWLPGQPLPQPAPIIPPPVVSSSSSSRTGLVPIAPATSSAVTGPSTPRPQARAAIDIHAEQEAGPLVSYVDGNARKDGIFPVSYHVKREGDDKNSVRTHIFHAPRRH